MEQLLFLAAAAAPAENVVQEIARTFGFRFDHFLAQVISFGIVAFLLHRFAYKPILSILEERRQRIAESLKNAERIKAELARAEAERQDILGKANAQANKLVEEARAAAARVQEQEVQKAVAQAEQIIAKAKEAAALDHARMLTELKRELGQLVVQTTAQVTGRILTPEDQKRLSEETTRALAA